ncbi:acyl-CoA desaturase [Aspergillus brunneoviolaceus CBS 621.78]|uniref:Acyl-CoA desaturase n=1 Tax=Aspergillus brunneoviolaceus CBS 621.78 TaxID=1450534 RepID=A0ACD1GQA0_9EURO|nr:acyl-CoA desaturase [Aspergillus brunneoviolaceus CBS 621.78]RAH51428.1 acyl-CoA desaturase [Aspergillus brunneoviolaceus CBS 621.78]
MEEINTFPDDDQKEHVTREPMTRRNWYQRLDWWGIIFTMVVPLYGLYQVWRIPLHPKTFIFAVVFGHFSGFSITAGYHRLWAHASYRATTPLKVFLAILGSSAGQGPIEWWVRSHRTHHRYTDTAKDPYSAHKGLLYSHMGWILFRRGARIYHGIDMSDINNDLVVRWQRRYYGGILLAMVFLFPTAVCGLGWGDWKGGFVNAGIVRMFAVQQATFCVNSLAHWMGDQPFNDRNSPRDHLVTAIITLGEGYHNYHHEFPTDYRNGADRWQWDPTKWVIWLWEQMGLAYDLKRFSTHDVDKCRLRQAQTDQASPSDWGVPTEGLPRLSWKDYIVVQARDGRRTLIAIDGVVHDVSSFMPDHPGGSQLLQDAIGKDATELFTGGVHLHSRLAHNKLATLRVAIAREVS